jgi:hypothetical protein
MPTIPERLTAIETTQASMFGVLTKIDHSINGNDQPGMKQNYVELKGKVDNACMELVGIKLERKEEFDIKRRTNKNIVLLVVGQILTLASAVALDFIRK